MKPIQIFALVTAMVMGATAQNSNSNGQAGSTGQAPAGNQTAPAATQTKKKAAPASTSKTASKTAAKTSAKGGGSQNGPITLTVPKSSKTAASSQKPAANQTVTTSKPATPNTATTSKPATPNKMAATKTATASKPATTSKTAAQTSAGTTGAPKKTAVGVATPPQKTPARSKSVAASGTAKHAQATVAQKKPQVKVVPPKGGAVAKAGTPVDANEAIMKIKATGRRDPFLSVIRSMPTTAAAPNCSVPGKKCLYIPELMVKGIAKDTDGQMLAVVIGGAAHRAYFLRENDQVFNGSVERITTDSVIFREFATDNLGRESAHEVVKKIPKS